jgi:hypothetical protein
MVGAEKRRALATSSTWRSRTRPAHPAPDAHLQHVHPPGPNRRFGEGGEGEDEEHKKLKEAIDKLNNETEDEDALADARRTRPRGLSLETEHTLKV